MTRRSHAIALVAIVVGVAAAGAWFAHARQRGSTAAAIDLADGRPKLFDFGMGLCEQCQRLKPVMERAARELGGSVDVHVLDIRQTDNERLAERFQLRAMPLVVLADGAGNELWRHEGFVDFPVLAQAVSEKVGKP